jgi:hypothetical protein
MLITIPMIAGFEWGIYLLFILTAIIVVKWVIGIVL